MSKKERVYRLITDPVDGETHDVMDGSMHSYCAAHALPELQKAYQQPLAGDPDVEGILASLDADVEEICARLRCWAKWVRYAPHMHESHGEMVVMPYKVELKWIGEGESGDWRPDDPDDTPYLRFYISKWDAENNAWRDVEGASYRTLLPINASDDIKQRAMEALMVEAHEGASKYTWEWMSWIGPADLYEIEE